MLKFLHQNLNSGDFYFNCNCRETSLCRKILMKFILDSRKDFTKNEKGIIIRGKMNESGKKETWGTKFNG